MSRSRTWRPDKRKRDGDDSEPEEREPILPPGWGPPTEAKIAAQHELRKRGSLKLYRDGWRRKLKDGLWYPCDSFGLRDPVTRALIDGRERSVCRRKPIREGDPCSAVPVTENEDENGQPMEPVKHWQDLEE